MSRRRHSDASDSSYTEHTARYPTRGGGGGSGGGGSGSGGGGGGRGGRGDRGDDGPATLKSIDPNEEKQLVDIIRTAGESEFLAYVLYIKDGDRASYAALDLLNGNVMLKQQTFLQEVGLLRVRPPWLNGVPIIVDKVEGIAHRGTKCLEFLKAYQQRGAVGQMGRRITRGRRNQFDTGQAFSFAQTLSSSPWDVKGTPADVTSGRVPRISAKVETARVTDRDGKAYEQTRALVDASAARWQRRGGA